MKFNIWQFAILCVLGTVVLALVGVLLGSILTGDAGDAYNAANAAYEGQFQMTPMAPLVYPADFTVCRGGKTETIIVPDDLRWNYNFLLAKEEAEKGDLYFGDCQ